MLLDKWVIMSDLMAQPWAMKIIQGKNSQNMSERIEFPGVSVLELWGIAKVSGFVRVMIKFKRVNNRK